MEIKGCDKQLLIFLQTVEAKYVSGNHTQQVYIIMEKMVHKSSWRFSHFSCALYIKLGFSRQFSGQQEVCIIHECALYMSAHYTWARQCPNVKKWHEGWNIPQIQANQTQCQLGYGYALKSLQHYKKQQPIFTMRTVS